jgi:AraC-like DNA-binding protein
MPLIPFLGCAQFGVGDAAMVGRAAELGFAEVLAEGVDESVIAPLAAVLSFTSRFAASMHDPPPALGLTAELQLAAWRAIVSGAGRTLSTNEVAKRCSVSREHLSRTFAARDAPTLKEAIDLVRLLSAAQLAKCPAYDLADVARLLGFTSPSQLSRMARRVLGRGATSLPRLRGDDLIRLWASTSGVATANSQGT